MERWEPNLHPQLRKIKERITEHRQRNNGNIDDTSWFSYNTDIQDYEKTFSGVLEEGDIVKFLKKRPNPVVVDLMAPTAALVSIAEQTPLQLGLAVSLDDFRDKEWKDEDKILNIDQVTGDLTCSSTWKEIDNILNGRKVDLVMERAKDGLIFIPHNKRFYAIIANRLWNMLSEGGMMLIEKRAIPKPMLKHDTLMPKWLALLEKKGIDPQFLKSEPYDNPVLKIVKPQFPKKLPLLK